MTGEPLSYARMLFLSPHNTTDAQTAFVESTYDAFGFVRCLRDRRGGERGERLRERAFGVRLDRAAVRRGRVVYTLHESCCIFLKAA